MFYVQLAPLGDILGPLKSDLGVILALSGDLFYTYKTFKLDFLKTLSSPDFDLFDS